MAVDLTDHVDSLKRAISPPGSDAFPDATDTQLVGYLSDAAWEAKLDGFIPNHTEADGIITPIEDDGDDLERDWIQLIIFYATLNIISNELRQKNTQFSAKAGPVEYETANSAQLLRDHLRTLTERRDFLIERLSNRYDLTYGFVDLICARTNAVINGDTTFNSGVSF